MAKFKEKQKNINARQVAVEEQINWGPGFNGDFIQTVTVGQWIVEDDQGNPITVYHASQFTKEFEENVQ